MTSSQSTWSRPMLTDHDKQHLLEYHHYFDASIKAAVETSIGLVYVMPNGDVVLNNEIIWSTRSDSHTR